MTVLRLLGVLAVGLLAGSLSLEGFVLVPYWRSLPSSDFADLHAGFAPRLYRFFAPLTTAAVVTSAAGGVATLWRAELSVHDWSMIVSAGLTASLLAFYALYFHSANERLPHLASAQDHVGLHAELRRWHRIHMVRTAVCVVAFALGVFGLAR